MSNPLMRVEIAICLTFNAGKDGASVEGKGGAAVQGLKEQLGQASSGAEEKKDEKDL